MKPKHHIARSPPDCNYSALLHLSLLNLYSSPPFANEDSGGTSSRLWFETTPVTVIGNAGQVWSA